MTQFVSGTFGATGVSTSHYILRQFNVDISGIAGGSIVELQRSYDQGSTWFTSDTFTQDISSNAVEVEKGVIYRFECTVYGSGTVIYRLGGSGLE